MEHDAGRHGEALAAGSSRPSGVRRLRRSLGVAGLMALVLTALPAAPASAAVGDINTVAGGGPDVPGDGGAATSAELLTPQSPSFDSAGNMYFVEAFNNAIRKVTPGSDGLVNGGSDEIISTVTPTVPAGFDSDGNPCSVAVLCPATEATFNTPDVVLATSSGDLYVSDNGNQRVRYVNMGTAGNDVVHGVDVAPGEVGTVAGSGPCKRALPTVPLVSTSPPCSQFGGDGGAATSALINLPYGLALDSSGNLFFADLGNRRVRRVDTAGTITTVAGTGTAGATGDNDAATSAQLHTPIGVAVDGSNNLFITDQHNHNVRKVVPGSDGIVDGGVNLMGELDPGDSETITTVAGCPANGTNCLSSGSGSTDGAAVGAGVLNAPFATVVDTSGNLYISDEDNHKVRKVSSGIISTVAGSGTAGFSGDGNAAGSAQLYKPRGVALATGDLYVADTSNDRVRRVDL